MNKKINVKSKQALLFIMLSYPIYYIARVTGGSTLIRHRFGWLNEVKATLAPERPVAIALSLQPMNTSLFSFTGNRELHLSPNPRLGLKSNEPTTYCHGTKK